MPQNDVRQTADYRESDPVSNVRDHFRPPAPKGLHDVRGVFIGSWACEICRCGDGVRLNRSGMEVHEFDFGLTGGKPFIGPQAGRKSSDKGFRSGVERDTWDGEFRRERATEDDKDWVGEGGLAERREEDAGEKGGEDGVPPDHSEVIIFGPLLEPDSCVCG